MKDTDTNADTVLDGATTDLIGRFTVTNGAGMVYGENLSGSIALQVKTAVGWVPVLEKGAAVVLSTTSDNPMGIYMNGQYRLVAASLGGTEKVYFSQ